MTCLQGRSASRSTSPFSHGRHESNVVPKFWRLRCASRARPYRRAQPAGCVVLAPHSGYDPLSLARQASRDTSRVMGHSASGAFEAMG